MFYDDEQYSKEIEKWKKIFTKECKVCEGQGYIQKDKLYNTIYPCECIKKSKAYAQLVCSGIPQGYLIGDYKWDMRRKFDTQCKMYADAFEKYYMKNGKGLYIYGGAGSGKTTMAVLIAKSVSLQQNKIKKGLYEPFFISYDEMIGLYSKARFNGEYDNKFKYLLNDVDLLILDGVGSERDIGSSGKSEYHVKTMQELLQKREQNKLPVILLSNLDPNSFKNTYDKSCFDIVNKNCDFVLVNGNNFRKNVSIEDFSEFEDGL